MAESLAAPMPLDAPVTIAVSPASDSAIYAG
jgi:hypothetical protein